MFVVKTTSATVGSSRPKRLPRKRAPSSRRRNPFLPRRKVTFSYGFLAGVFSAGALELFGAVVVAGADVPGAAPVGAGVNGTPGLAAPPAGGVAGAVAGGVENV